MAFLTNLSALKSLGNPFISLLFSNQCLVCSGGESHSPDPLHPVKFWERGCNQEEWIAKGLGDDLDIPVKNDLIKRIRYTNAHTAFNQAEQLENMKQAFIVAGSVMGLALGIVDDVLTIGSTLSSRSFKKIRCSFDLCFDDCHTIGTKK